MPHIKTLNKGSLARKSFCLGATAFSFSCFRFAAIPDMLTELLHEAGNNQDTMELTSGVFYFIQKDWDEVLATASSCYWKTSGTRCKQDGENTNFPASLNWGGITYDAFFFFFLPGPAHMAVFHDTRVDTPKVWPLFEWWC